MIEFDIDIPTRAGAVPTFVCHPERDGPHPPVLFLMDAPGIRDELRDMVRRLASVGYLVLLPNSDQSGISRKIENVEERQRLKKIVRELTIPEGMGVILRTAGASRWACHLLEFRKVGMAAEKDLGKAEGIAVPITVILLMFVFGSVVAAGLLAGVHHALTGPDHLAGVAPLVARGRGIGQRDLERVDAGALQHTRELRGIIRRRVEVRRFAAAAEHPFRTTLGAELDDHVRALVDDPDVVLLVDLHRVGIGPGVHVLADLADELARLDLAETVDDALRREGLARDLVRAVNDLRKARGFEIADRIDLRFRAEGEVALAISEHGDRIAEEVLAPRWDLEETVPDATDGWNQIGRAHV